VNTRERIRALLRRPVVAFAVIAGVFMLLFPNFGPKNVTFQYRLPPEGCASNLMIAAYEGEGLARSSKHHVQGLRSFEHSFLLPKGDYELRVSLGCEDSDAEAEVSRRIALDQHETLSFDLGAFCPCRSGPGRGPG
jgi:hypothetical protein